MAVAEIPLAAVSEQQDLPHAPEPTELHSSSDRAGALVIVLARAKILPDTGSGAHDFINHQIGGLEEAVQADHLPGDALIRPYYEPNLHDRRLPMATLLDRLDSRYGALPTFDTILWSQFDSATLNKRMPNEESLDAGTPANLRGRVMGMIGSLHFIGKPWHEQQADTSRFIDEYPADRKGHTNVSVMTPAGYAILRAVEIELGAEGNVPDSDFVTSTHFVQHNTMRIKGRDGPQGPAANSSGGRLKLVQADSYMCIVPDLYTTKGGVRLAVGQVARVSS